MNYPTLPTIKRLFALSRNQCAFPNCTNTLVEEKSGKVTGRICHIKAHNENGPRYDSQQIDEERHGFDNLLLMCPIHHDVIDSNINTYTVEVLTDIKKRHELQNNQATDTEDKVASDLLENFINEGTIIMSKNQVGVQTATSITNNFIVDEKDNVKHSSHDDGQKNYSSSAKDLIFEKNIYWHKDGKEQRSPFCPRCWDKDKILMHLIKDNPEYDNYRCPECDKRYINQLISPAKPIIIKNDMKPFRRKSF